ncbi:MAG: HAD family hydrolase [Minisyncoccia bacterium]
MSRKYRAILWDFDGVIYNSDKAAWVAANVLLSRHGIPPETYEKFRHRANNHFDWYVERGIPWDAEECRAFFHEVYDDSGCGLVSGAHGVLTRLRDQRMPCGIVSARGLESLVPKLHAFGMNEYFYPILGGSHFKQEALKSACKTLGVEPASILFIGDMLSDVRDGNAAGVTTILFAPADSPHASNADYHITHLEQLFPLVLDL